MCELEIGVVVPTLNCGKTLEWTLLALSSQEGCRVKVIVVDSGSTDETLEICKRHKLRTEYEPPGNMYRAINVGMRHLDTKWITYLNSDDIVYSNSYSRMIALGNQKGADIVYGDSDFIDWQGRFICSIKSACPGLLPGLIHGGLMQFAQPASIFRRTAYDKLNGFSDKYRSIADFEFFARGVHSDVKFARLSGPAVSAFRLHPDQFSRNRNRLAKEEILQFYEEWGFRSPVIGILSLSVWRVLNAKQYLLRTLRTGALRSSIPG